MLSTVALSVLLLPHKDVRILFIGNSHTYVHNVPIMVAAMAPKHLTVHTGSVVAPGATLDQHLKSKQLADALKQPWDYVLFHDQSSLGRPLLVEGVQRVYDDRDFQVKSKELVKRIRVIGAQPVLV